MAVSLKAKQAIQRIKCNLRRQKEKYKIVDIKNLPPKYGERLEVSFKIPNQAHYHSSYYYCSYLLRILFHVNKPKLCLNGFTCWGTDELLISLELRESNYYNFPNIETQIIRVEEISKQIND